MFGNVAKQNPTSVRKADVIQITRLISGAHSESQLRQMTTIRCLLEWKIARPLQNEPESTLTGVSDLQSWVYSCTKWNPATNCKCVTVNHVIIWKDTSQNDHENDQWQLKTEQLDLCLSSPAIRREADGDVSSWCSYWFFPTSVSLQTFGSF